MGFFVVVFRLRFCVLCVCVFVLFVCLLSEEVGLLTGKCIIKCTVQKYEKTETKNDSGSLENKT